MHDAAQRFEALFETQFPRVYAEALRRLSSPTEARRVSEIVLMCLACDPRGGAGPGDPERMTLRALRLTRSEVERRIRLRAKMDAAGRLEQRAAGRLCAAAEWVRNLLGGRASAEDRPVASAR